MSSARATSVRTPARPPRGRGRTVDLACAPRRRRAEIEWRAPPPAAPTARRSNASSSASCASRRARRGFVFHSRGDVKAALAGSARRVEAFYRAPYLAHAALEPINCTARVADGKVELWLPTQVPTAARAIAARVAGVDEAAVTLHVTYLGGGFGRRLEVDFIGQAVRVALETGGRPVMLVWSREEDFSHDFYRPAGAALLRAGLDREGRVVAIAITSAGEAPIMRLLERTLPWLAGPVRPADRRPAKGCSICLTGSQASASPMSRPAMMYRSARGARSATRTTRSSARVSSTNWRMRRASTRCSSGSRCWDMPRHRGGAAAGRREGRLGDAVAARRARPRRRAAPKASAASSRWSSRRRSTRHAAGAQRGVPRSTAASRSPRASSRGRWNRR